MAKAADLTGRRFGRWVVISRAENTKGGKTQWLCCCDCGTVKIVRAEHLRSGRSQSCGCFSSEVTAERNRTHGFAHSRLYNIWCGMKDRCTRERNPKYKDYGGRGIVVCEEWKNDFQAFKHWADENGYSDSLTIDRIDVNGNYCPGNCRWADKEEQGNNKRDNTVVAYNGESHTVAEWAKLGGLTYNTLLSRLQRGKTIEEALKEPVLTNKQRMENDEKYRGKAIAAMKSNRPNKKAVLMLDKDTCEVLMEFEKLMDAAEWIRKNTHFQKADYSTINKCAKTGLSRTAYGYRWKLK